MSLQVEKYFEPFERMVEQFALDKDVKELLTTTKAGERMPDNAIYSTVLEKMVEVADVMEQSKTQMAQMREAMDKIQETAQMADEVVEVVYGIPVYHKCMKKEEHK